MNKLLALFAALSVAVVAAFGWAHWPTATLPAGAHADRVVVEKAQHRLLLLRGGRVLASYRIALGSHPRGPKLEDGDGHTPEGLYVIDYRLPTTPFSRALHISYPNAADWARASAHHVDPGGGVLLHGLPRRLVMLGRLHRFLAWTDGSIAVTNGEIEQIAAAVPDGTPIELRP